MRPRLGTTLAPTRLRVALTRVVGASVVCSGAWYLWWRRLTVGGTGLVGGGFYTAEVAGYVMLAATAVLLTRTRRRLEGPQQPPSGTLDVFVTACGEPVEMVEATLRAAQAISYPHRTYLLNDGRIAGKPSWRDTERMAGRLGVTCFTRVDGARGKAGNLNHALARTRGELVATIDADHVAEPTLASDTLGYLADPRVAFVTTAQRFVHQGADLLNNREPIFYHGLQPAKDVDGCAFSCGNGSVYRRAALDDVGGFSEWNLVEDLHTSYRLHAQGWDSVYHPHPVTTGIAPVTAAVYLTQRLRWAMDSLRLLFFDSPLVRTGLTLRRRLHYLHTTGFYVVASLHLVLLLAPPAYVLWRLSVMTGFGAGDYLRNGAAYLVSILAMLLVSCGWRGTLGTLQGASFAWPVYGLAIIRTLMGALPSTEPTAKARQPAFCVLLVPVVVCFAAQVAALAVGLVDRRPGAAGVAVFWSGLQAFLLAGPVSALSESVTVRHRIASTLRTSVAVTAVAAVVTAHSVASGPLPVEALVVDAGDADVPRARLVPPSDGAYLGVMQPEVPHRTTDVTAWVTRTGHRPQIVHWFQQWRSGEVRLRLDWMQQVAAHGAVPMITWEPWAKPEGAYRDPDQRSARLRHIIEGDHDDYILAWARGMAEYGGPVLLRPMHEMNAWWYPWAVDVNGNAAADYVAAWRHIHDIFTEAGADNVTWVWSLNELAGVSSDESMLTDAYPGDAYVDWIGMTGFNWGRTQSWARWRDVDEIYRRTYRRLAAFGKPIMIPEIGTVEQGGSAPRWVRATLDRLREYPLVKAVVWYDGRYSSTADFSLAEHAASFRAAAADPHWATVPRLERLGQRVVRR